MSTILVTGATTGLGLALSKLLLERTASVLVLTGRENSLPRLEAAGLGASERLCAMALDVTGLISACDPAHIRIDCQF